MISREDIENEAAFVRSLINPTGLEHTPTPWHKAASVNDLHLILDGDGKMLATFGREADRDLAHYFVSQHAAIISMVRQMAGAFEFLARSTTDEGAKHFAETQAANAHAYADLFARLGRTQ